MTDYDWLETFSLINDLALPTSLRAILSIQVESLKSLKREIYDYIHDSARKNFLQSLRFFYWKNRYETLKIKLAVGILTFKRFQDEFSNSGMKLHFHGKELVDFRKGKINSDELDETLHDYFQKTFQHQVSKLNRDIDTLEHVFRPFEDLHIYKINVWLQLTSVIIAILALVLTFDKVVETAKNLWSFIINLF